MRNTFYLCLLLLLAPSALSADSIENGSGDAAHRALLSETQFPSAKQCGTCHPVQYKEWAASPHAYAQLSPVFGAMNAKLLKLTNGTLGDFCIRCHTPVGMERGEPIAASNLERHAVSLEGVTCITCHRRPLPEGKSSGRFAMNHGDITAAILGRTAVRSCVGFWQVIATKSAVQRMRLDDRFTGTLSRWRRLRLRRSAALATM